MSEWRTIDSAPKDGTAIWLWHDGDAYIGYGEFSERVGRFRWSIKLHPQREAGKGDRSCMMSWRLNEGEEPTHWAPLPSPPEDSQ